MIGPLVLQVVGAGESILMANFLLRARGTIMPIFHIKAAGEAHILVSPLLDHIRRLRILMLGGLDAFWDAWDYLITTNKGDWSSLLHRTARIAPSASVMGVVTTMTAASGRLDPLLSWCKQGDCWGDKVALSRGMGPECRFA